MKNNSLGPDVSFKGRNRISRHTSALFIRHIFGNSKPGGRGSVLDLPPLSSALLLKAHTKRSNKENLSLWRFSPQFRTLISHDVRTCREVEAPFQTCLCPCVQEDKTDDGRSSNSTLFPCMFTIARYRMQE